MKNLSLKSVIVTSLLMATSCIETTVTNYVHTDGSITRIVEMKDSESRNFDRNSYRVPVDSTWTITDTFEINDEKDTTWVRKAEKLFKNTDEINTSYKNDSGPNQGFPREARFTKKFQWFNTIYVFSENVEKIFTYGLPVENFLSKEELEYFRLPDNIIQERSLGPDSTQVKQVLDSVETKSEYWLQMSTISEWKHEFVILAEKKSNWEKDKIILQNIDTLIYSELSKVQADTTVDQNLETVLFTVMNNVFGSDNYNAYKTEIDSSINIVEGRVNKAYGFSGYDLKTVMPGNLVSTNGFINENGEVLWEVKMELFLTEPLEMRAESKISNTWAWIVSAVFVLFVVTGLIFRISRKKNR